MGRALNKLGHSASTVAGLMVGLGLFSGASAQSPPALAVTRVQFWSLGEATRVAIETTGEFKYHWVRLENPDRIYFDLVGARSMLGKAQHVIAVGDALLKQIRVAETQPGVTRVVLDLARVVEVTRSQMANPDRLVLELRAPAGVPAPPPAPALAGGQRLPGAEPPAAVIPPPEKSIPPEPVARQPAPAREQARVALPAEKNRSGNHSMTRTLGLKLSRVVLDPGHGGHDVGSSSPNGLLEKELVLDVARRLGSLIQERMGSEVVYTRTEDAFLSLEARTELANQQKADLFLSIHANSSPYKYVFGAETYVLNFSASRADLELAARENASSQRSIHELSELIRRIALRDKLEESRDFAARVQAAMQELVQRTGAKTKNRGVKRAPFVVLIGATMPSILTEIGFVSNAREESLLGRSDYRQRIAEALYKGISRYAGSLSRFQIAQQKAP